MEWFAKLFEKYPEMGVYLAIGIGYLIARIKVRGVGLGAVTGSLLGGILIGNCFHVPVSDEAKSILFLLFLFGIGYSVGPSFFRNLKGDGLRWALLGAFIPVVGLFTAYAVARFLKLDLGFSAGLLSGSLTESPAIGTASEAIRALSLPDSQKQQLIGHIAVADAICYIFGTIGVIWRCSSLGRSCWASTYVRNRKNWNRVWEYVNPRWESSLRGSRSDFVRTRWLRTHLSLVRQ
jgi:putative transport protein